MWLVVLHGLSQRGRERDLSLTYTIPMGTSTQLIESRNLLFTTLLKFDEKYISCQKYILLRYYLVEENQLPFSITSKHIYREDYTIK